MTNTAVALAGLLVVVGLTETQGSQAADQRLGRSGDR